MRHAMTHSKSSMAAQMDGHATGRPTDGLNRELRNARDTLIIANHANT